MTALSAVYHPYHLFTLQNLPAIVTAVLVMLFFTEIINTFIKRHPTIQLLALSFLILIGVFLIMGSFGKRMDQNYIYFAMGFSLAVEVLNMKMRRMSGGSPHTAHWGIGAVYFQNIPVNMTIAYSRHSPW